MISRARKLRRLLGRMRRDQRGATAIEYAMIAVGIGCAVAATVAGTGGKLKNDYYGRIEQNVR